MLRSQLRNANLKSEEKMSRGSSIGALNRDLTDIKSGSSVLIMGNKGEFAQTLANVLSHLISIGQRVADKVRYR